MGFVLTLYPDAPLTALHDTVCVPPDSETDGLGAGGVDASVVAELVFDAPDVPALL